MKGNQNLKEFFIELMNTMEREDTTSVDVTFAFPDETIVTFQVSVASVEKPDGTTVEFS